jgi:MFS family permease
MSVIAASRERRWRTALSVLANRDFVLLWTAWGLLGLAWAIGNIAMMNLIYDQTGSAGGVGVLMFTSIFSTVVVAPVSGVLADRLDRRNLLIGIDVSRAVLTFLLVWAHTPLVIYAVNFAVAGAAMLYMPARSAVVPDLVKRKQLLDANAIDGSLGTLAKIVGPLLGGLIVDRFSLEAAFLFSGTLYLLAALSVLVARIPPPSILRGEATLRAVVEEFVEGVRYARVNPVVFTLITIYLVLLTGGGLGLSLDVVFAEQVLAGETLSTATAFSYMMSAMSAGMFAGSLLVRYLGRLYPKKRLLLVALGMISVDGLGLALVRSLPLTLGAKFGTGLGRGLSMSLWPTLLQENVEEDKIGRSFSLFMGVVSIPPALTVYLGGWLTDQTSVRLVYGMAGVWMLLTAVGSRFLPGYRAIPTHSGNGPQ